MAAKRRKRRKNRIWLYFVATMLGTLLVLYGAVAVYYMLHFGPKTYVNGELAANKTVKDMQKDVVATSSKYVLKISGRDNVTDMISSADVSLNPEFDGEFEAILKQQKALLWPLLFVKEQSYETDTVVSYSKDDLRAVVKNLAFFKPENITAPEDAHLSTEAGENGFEIIPETKGCKPISDQVYEEIKGAVDLLLDEVSLSDACYETAAIKSDAPSLSQELARINEFCDVNIIYEFGDDVIKVDGNQIMQWLTETEDGFVLNEDEVKDFVVQLARTYDTFGITRQFTTHEGETFDLVGGDYGWWMNRDGETKGLIEAIRNHEKGVRVPEYFATAAKYGNDDYGDTYVEIDLTSQHLWVYEKGEVVIESDFVSGNVNKGNGTPTGAYAITYKERDATLNGENYSSPVSYWMPFNGNVGMHDASWRREFGEEIYLTNGSHGCINLPVEKAAEIYDVVTKREPVIVYGGKSAPEIEEKPDQLSPEEQIALLIQLGYLNPDGTPSDNPPAPIIQQ